MNEGVGTLGPSSTFALVGALTAWDGPNWVLTAWDGPSRGGVLTRLWGRARGALVDRLRPKAARAGIVELLRLFEATDGFERALMAHAHSDYDRGDLDAIVIDPEISARYEQVGLAAIVVIRDHPHWLGKPRASNLFPRRALRDPAVHARVSGGATQVGDMTVALRGLLASAISTDPEFERGQETPVEERDSSPCWWAYDPGFPTAIAERLLAGRRAGFIPALVRISRRTWTDDSVRRAALDWADDLADYAGLFASIPGVTMPSVPADRRFDLAAVIAHHRHVRVGSAAHFEHGLASFRSN